MQRAPFTADLLVCGHIHVTCDSDTVVLHLQGEFDCSTADALIDRLGEAVPGDAAKVVIDLEQVTFLDSATVRAFEDAAAALATSRRTLVLRGPSAFMRRVLHLCSATSLLEPDARAVTYASVPMR